MGGCSSAGSMARMVQSAGRRPSGRCAKPSQSFPQLRLLRLSERGGKPSDCSRIKAAAPLAEGGDPSSDGVWIPSQGLRHTRSPPSLGSSQMACHRSRSRSVGARIRRRCKSLASICHCSRNRPISLTLTTSPSPTPYRANPVPPQIYRITLHISPGVWFSTFQLRFGKNYPTLSGRLQSLLQTVRGRAVEPPAA